MWSDDVSEAHKKRSKETNKKKTSQAPLMELRQSPIVLKARLLIAANEEVLKSAREIATKDLSTYCLLLNLRDLRVRIRIIFCNQAGLFVSNEY